MSGKTATLTSRSPRVTGEKMEAYRSEYIFEDGSESYDGSTETNVHVTFDLDSMSIAVEEMKYQHWKGGGGQRLYGKWANEWEAEGNCSKDDSGE